MPHESHRGCRRCTHHDLGHCVDTTSQSVQYNLYSARYVRDAADTQASDNFAGIHEAIGIDGLFKRTHHIEFHTVFVLPHEIQL